MYHYIFFVFNSSVFGLENKGPLYVDVLNPSIDQDSTDYYWPSENSQRRTSKESYQVLKNKNESLKDSIEAISQAFYK